jgi:hypothetical protein
LGGNPLAQLSAQAFRRLGLLHLQRILLQRCSIRSVERPTFMGLTNFVELDLSHNNLATIPYTCFSSAERGKNFRPSVGAAQAVSRSARSHRSPSPTFLYKTR